MLTARRLLIGGGGSFPTPVPASVSTLLTAPRGSWGNVDPRAFYYNGATYFTWVDGQTGDIGVSKYVHSTKAVTSTVLAAAYNRDDHANPSVIVREPDHRVVVAWSGHDSASFRVWISTNPEDISAGSATDNGSSDFTYFTLVQLNGVTDQPVYAFYRVMSGGTGYLTYFVSTTGMATFPTPAVTLFTADSSGHVPYWRIASDWDRYIHIFTTNSEPGGAGTDGLGTYLYHFYIDGADGSLHKSDGTVIGASLPLKSASVTLVTDGDGSGGYCMTHGACVDGSGRPAVMVRVGLSAQTNNAQRVARWTGAAWQTDEVYQTGGVYSHGGTTWVYSPGAGIHKTNPNVVYGSKKVGSNFVISRFVSPDDGATWNETPLGSTNDSFQPETPVNAAAGLDALWPFGSANSDTDFNFGMEGYG